MRIIIWMTSKTAIRSTSTVYAESFQNITAAPLFSFLIIRVLRMPKGFCSLPMKQYMRSVIWLESQTPTILSICSKKKQGQPRLYSSRMPLWLYVSYAILENGMSIYDKYTGCIVFLCNFSDYFMNYAACHLTYINLVRCYSYITQCRIEIVIEPDN